MTKFNDENLNFDGMYLNYVPYKFAPHNERKFVARFKQVKGHKSFIKFLKAHFTVEEYFAERAKDANNGPLEILERKGYLLPHIVKWLNNGTIKEFKGHKSPVHFPGAPMVKVSFKKAA